MWGKLFGTRSGGHRLRRAERYGTRDHGLRTHLGDVLDLSAVGVRVKSADKPTVEPGDMLHLGVDNGSQAVRLAGRVAWVRRAGGAWQVGVEFINVQPAVASALTQIAKYGFVNTTHGSPAGESDPRAHASPQAAAEGGPPRTPMRAVIEVEDLYAVLGVPRTAGEAEIRAAYYKLAKTHHPDVTGAPGTEERFAMISKSWSVLRNPTLRAKYDALLKTAA